MRTLIKTSLFMLTAAIVSSCNHKNNDIEIYRLDTQLPLGIMPEDSVEILGAKKLFDICGYNEFSPTSLKEYANKQSIRYHNEAVGKEFADLKHESHELGEIFARFEQELPLTYRPTVFSIISPYTQSIMVTDSMLFIGLNHYLGTGYEAYEAFPEYIRKLKTRDRLPIDVTEALIRSTYPFRPSVVQAPTTVERLAYEGAVAEAIITLAETTEGNALGKDSKEMEWLNDNEQNIWKVLLEREMLFSTDNYIVRNICDDAPNATAIHRDAPGRTGRFIGYRLVKSYLKSHPETTLEQLLSPALYSSPELLKEARYNP